MSFSWDSKSAFKKATSGIDVVISTPTPIVSLSKSIQLTPPNNPNENAFRKCQNCGKHWNFHKNGKCN